MVAGDAAAFLTVPAVRSAPTAHFAAQAEAVNRLGHTHRPPRPPHSAPDADAMERESNPMQALCRSGCGFYGNPATDGLCSLCFKEALKKKQQPPQSVPAPSTGAAVAAAQSQQQAPLIDTATALPTVQCIPAAAADSAKEVRHRGSYWVRELVLCFNSLLFHNYFNSLFITS